MPWAIVRICWQGPRAIWLSSLQSWLITRSCCGRPYVWDALLPVKHSNTICLKYRCTKPRAILRLVCNCVARQVASLLTNFECWYIYQPQIGHAAGDRTYGMRNLLRSETEETFGSRSEWVPREPHKLLGLIPTSVQSAVVMEFERQLLAFGIVHNKISLNDNFWWTLPTFPNGMDYNKMGHLPWVVKQVW